MTTPFLNKRVVQSVFGNYEINEDEVDVTVNNEDSVYDYILRDPQYKSLQNEIEQVSNESMIQFNPSGYLDLKKKDIEKIAKELQKKYQEDYIALLKKTFTQSEAKKMALQQSEKRKEFLMNIHKKQFPKDPSYFKDRI